MLISSRYTQKKLPINPSRRCSITCIARAGALVSPYSITLHAKELKRVIIVFYFFSSGHNLIWKYQFNRSMNVQNFTQARVLSGRAKFGMAP
jgi:hypothetical protein